MDGSERETLMASRYERFTVTVYHSRDWEHLVEQGWVTMYTEPDPLGFQRAYMIWQS